MQPQSGPQINQYGTGKCFVIHIVTVGILFQMNFPVIFTVQIHRNLIWKFECASTSSLQHKYGFICGLLEIVFCMCFKCFLYVYWICNTNFVWLFTVCYALISKSLNLNLKIYFSLYNHWKLKIQLSNYYTNPSTRSHL